MRKLSIRWIPNPRPPTAPTKAFLFSFSISLRNIFWEYIFPIVSWIWRLTFKGIVNNQADTSGNWVDYEPYLSFTKADVAAWSWVCNWPSVISWNISVNLRGRNYMNIKSISQDSAILGDVSRSRLELTSTILSPLSLFRRPRSASVKSVNPSS